MNEAIELQAAVARYRLNALHLMPPISVSLPVHANNQEIRTVEKVFVENLNRSYCLATFPPYAMALALERQQFTCEAKLELFGHIGPTPEESPAETTRKLLDLTQQKHADYIRDAPMQDLLAQRWQIGVGILIEAMVLGSDNPFRFAIEALLASVITGAWTAFEVMAADLWTAAVNAHPKGLANLKGKRFGEWRVGREEQDVDTERTEIDDSPSKLVNLNDLATYGFDLSSRMGTVLRRKFRFTTLQGIRRAYCAAFSKNADALREIVTDHAFDDLSAVRNLIVHKAGFVDAEFKRQVGTNASLGAFEIGSKLELNGAMVVELFTRALMKSVAMIEFVDTVVRDNEGE